MKKFLSIFILLPLIFSSCNRLPEENRVIEKGVLDEVFTVQVTEAKCPKCQKVIEDGLGLQDGVRQSILNLHTNELSVVYNPKVVSNEEINANLKKIHDVT